MALTTQMMDILIEEFFTDPKKLGYMNYVHLEGTTIYIPQLKHAINESYDIQIKNCNHENNIPCSEVPDLHTYILLRNRGIPRICELFSGIDGAPNALSCGDIRECFEYYGTLHPEEIAGLTIQEW